MHVTRVELDNIKSYEHAVFTFERGVTAITGENGAGKTTILEAVAWALFDTLEYSKEDFLRRGAKKGSVRVTFETDKDIDGRQYTVYRDTGAGYYIYDPGLGGKIAEQRTNVGPKLRQLLGIEPGTDIRALFTSAIGVPQGTFTADFLRPATQRKASFDKLLKVEEYREGAERLRDTVKLIGERTTEVRERIAGAEGQLANYDQLVAEHKEAVARVRELDQSLAELQKEITQRASVVEELDRAETLVTETRSRMDRLEVERDASARRMEDAGRERDAASVALEKQRAAETDYKAHIEVLATIARLETERAKREQLRERVQQAEAILASSKAHVKSLEDSLLRATQAAQSVVALEPEISEQTDLEKERERLRDLRARAISARERLAQLDQELELLRSQHVQTRERMKDAEKGQGAQERVARLESERLGVETSLSKAEKAATSLDHLTKQKKDAARETERLRREISSHEKLIADLQKRSAKAAEAAPLATRETELTEQLANLKAEITRDERFHAEVKGGLCPILSERCLNIGEGQTLEDYFKDSFATNTTQLKALEKERASVAVAVREAREAEKHLTRLESARSQMRSAQELLKEREATLARIDLEIAALSDANVSRLSELKFQLFGIDGELKDVREAAMRYAELQPLQDRLKEIEQEGKRRKDDRANVAAEADAVAGLE
ncbi:MAG: SMC family ATPase, partial [Pyrinomonadaceae bacterium]